MKKDYTRDYATEVFRKYAAAGMPTYKQEQERIYNSALAEYQHYGTNVAVEQAEIAVAKSAPYLSDIMAAESTFSILASGEEHNIARAVKAVYCVSPLSPLRRGDITDRVNRFALTCPADKSTVYRWLKYARLLCASLRGLSIPDTDRKEYNINLR